MRWLVVGIGAVMLIQQPEARLIGFDNITKNNAANELIGESQLSVDVTDVSYGENLAATDVLFTFKNAGPAPCSISEVYFDDDALFADMTNIINMTGVKFVEGASPSNLPGWASITPKFQAMFAAESTSPNVQKNGVNPGEQVGIQFSLLSGYSLGDLYDDLDSDDMRIGIHVRAFANGGSEGFVNRKVPEPSLCMLIGLGLFGLAGLGIRKRK